MEPSRQPEGIDAFSEIMSAQFEADAWSQIEQWHEFGLSRYFSHLEPVSDTGRYIVQLKLNVRHADDTYRDTCSANRPRKIIRETLRSSYVAHHLRSGFNEFYRKLASDVSYNQALERVHQQRLESIATSPHQEAFGGANGYNTQTFSKRIGCTLSWHCGLINTLIPAHVD